MKQLVLKVRTTNGREQCVLSCEHPCEFLLGTDGDWRPAGLRDSALARMQYDGEDWSIHALCGSLRLEGMPIPAPLQLYAPAVLSFGSAWLIIDDELEIGVPKIRLKGLLAASLLRRSGAPQQSERKPQLAKSAPTSTTALVVTAVANLTRPDDFDAAETLIWSGTYKALNDAIDVTQTVDAEALYRDLAARSSGPSARSSEVDAIAMPTEPALVTSVSRTERKRSRVTAWALALAVSLPMSVQLSSLVRRAQAKAASQLMAPASQTSPAQARPSTPVVSAPQIPEAEPGRARFSPKQAADALIRGDANEAASAYRSLSRSQPKNEVYAVIADILTRRNSRVGSP